MRNRIIITVDINPGSVKNQKSYPASENWRLRENRQFLMRTLGDAIDSEADRWQFGQLLAEQIELDDGTKGVVFSIGEEQDVTLARAVEYLEGVANRIHRALGR